MQHFCYKFPNARRSCLVMRPALCVDLSAGTRQSAAMTQTQDTRPVALITGASRGLGAALAEALAPDHHVVAVARTIGALEELDDRIKA